MLIYFTRTMTITRSKLTKIVGFVFQLFITVMDKLRLDIKAMDEVV